MFTKITITDFCGAKCKTCLSHLVSKNEKMTPNDLRDTFARLQNVSSSFFINGVGDYLSLENNQEYSDIISERFSNDRKFTSVTTVCGFKNKPKINCSVIICSLNCVDKQSFEKNINNSVGFDKTIENINYICDNFGVVQIHSLKWEGNQNPEESLLKLFGSKNCKIRISEKVDNKNPGNEPRISCDYLDSLNVYPNGQIRICSHDWFKKDIASEDFNLEKATNYINDKKNKHQQNIFDGACANCNYNLKRGQSIFYIK